MADEEIKPLSTWEKIKSGVVGFVKNVVNYIPRGMLIAAALFAGSAALGAMGIWDPLKIGATFTSDGSKGILMAFGKSVLIGTLLSGGFGAWEHIKECEDCHNREAMARMGVGQARTRAKEHSADRHSDAAVIETALHQSLPHSIGASKSIIGM